MLCTLYWGEGTKHRNRFQISNSDIFMIKIVHDYITKLDVRFKPYLTIYSYLNPGFTKTDILKKWKVVKVPIKLKILKTKKRFVHAHRKLYYGTGHYCINSTELIQQVLGGIEYIREVGIVW